eukprot:3681233-Rhodomonas_salina.1
MRASVWTCVMRVTAPPALPPADQDKKPASVLPAIRVRGPSCRQTRQATPHPSGCVGDNPNPILSLPAPPKRSSLLRPQPTLNDDPQTSSRPQQL